MSAVDFAAPVLAVAAAIDAADRGAPTDGAAAREALAVAVEAVEELLEDPGTDRPTALGQLIVFYRQLGDVLDLAVAGDGDNAATVFRAGFLELVMGGRRG